MEALFELTEDSQNISLSKGLARRRVQALNLISETLLWFVYFFGRIDTSAWSGMRSWRNYPVLVGMSASNICQPHFRPL